MLPHKLRIKSSIAGLVVALVCFPIAAQQSGPRRKPKIVSNDDFLSLLQQVKELKNPVFRAFLRTRILSWESTEPGPRRQAALEAAIEGVTDLCEHQDQVWTPTASWLHESLVQRIKTLQSPEESALEICVLKTETPSDSAKDFSTASKMMRNPETSAAGVGLMKSAILSGQVSADAILGQLVFLESKQSPHLAELLSAVLAIEERRPGTLPLRLMPFFCPTFLAKSVPPDIVTRFVSVAVRSSRRSSEELASPIVRSQVYSLLNGIVMAAQRFAPDLYPEISRRLSFMNRSDPNRTDMRIAAEERIQNASDQLEQLITEANSASDEELKTGFFFRAARLAKEKGQLNKAIDLAMKAANGRELDKNGTTSSWLNEFMSELVSVALNKKTPDDAIYAISKMTRALAKARGFRLLGEYYGTNQDSVKSKEAFTQAAKQLKSVDNSNAKASALLFLAESVWKYEPGDEFEVFRESVKAINDLPSPGKDDDRMYYVKLMSLAEDLSRSFMLLASREDQIATSLAGEIKLAELRVSALSGVYGSH